MEAHCSTGDPCGTVKEASFFYLRNRCHVVFKKNRIESSHCAFTFYFLNIAPLHQKDNTIHANSCFSALLLIAFFSNYTMCSKPLYNLLLIFFLAAVPFIYFDRAFMILCAHRAQLCGKIRLFCCIFLFLRNYLFRMRLFAAGPGGWLGALWEEWQVCGARFPFFCGAMGTPHPCKRFAVFAAAGAGLVDCTPANGTPFSLYNGVRVCCRYAIRFFVPPAPPLIPGSPLPISICASS